MKRVAAEQPTIVSTPDTGGTAPTRAEPLAEVVGLDAEDVEAAVRIAKHAADRPSHCPLNYLGAVSNP